MAELADAYGSGPYEWKFVQVQVLLGAPLKKGNTLVLSFFILQAMQLTRLEGDR